MFHLVKFSCGCVGTLPVKGKSVTIYDCRSEDGSLCFFDKTIMGNKTFEDLSEEESLKYTNELSLLIHQGYALRQIKSLLG
jgi:hypothetical protein